MAIGVHFALSVLDEKRLLGAAGDDDALIAIVEDIEERAHEGHGLWCDLDHAWEAIHRCLTDGRLEYANGTLPLRAAILGGRQLVEKDEYTVSYVTAAQVSEVADALEIIEEEWFRQRYATLADTDYPGPHDEDDFEYTWDGFQDLREFFSEAARVGQGVIFTVDA